MSVLLIEPDDTNGTAIVRRLVSEGDEVGVIVADAAARERWRSLGAYVAVGPGDDADLVERAAQHARSVVLFDAGEDTVAAVVAGVRMAGTPRLVYCSTGIGEMTAVLDASGLEYVVLTIPTRTTGLRRRAHQAISPERVADAVSAADDLGGEVRLTADLATKSGVAALRLEA